MDLYFRIPRHGRPLWSGRLEIRRSRFGGPQIGYVMLLGDDGLRFAAPDVEDTVKRWMQARCWHEIERLWDSSLETSADHRRAAV